MCTKSIGAVCISYYFIHTKYHINFVRWISQFYQLFWAHLFSYKYVSMDQIFNNMQFKRKYRFWLINIEQSRQPETCFPHSSRIPSNASDNLSDHFHQLINLMGFETPFSHHQNLFSHPIDLSCHLILFFRLANIFRCDFVWLCCVQNGIREKYAKTK